MPQNNGVQSLERAAAILEQLTEARDGLGITELAELTGLHKSTVHRLISTLVTLGYVEKGANNEKYQLGMKLLHMGAAILDKMDLRVRAHDLLQQLSERVNETVHLVIPDGDTVLYIDKIDSNKTIRMYSQIGRRAPMHASAVGKVILAYSPKDAVDKIIKKGLNRFTPTTIADPQELIEHLKQVRNQGYALDQEEHEEGIRCVAAPIFNYMDEVVGAVSISSPTIVLTPDKVKELSREVIDCAEKISERMGWKSPTKKVPN